MQKEITQPIAGISRRLITIVRGSFGVLPNQLTGVILTLALFATQTAAAQQSASKLCSTKQYGFFKTIAVIVAALCIVGIVIVIFAGGLMRSLAFVSRSMGQMGNQALIFGGLGIAMIAFMLLIAGAAYSNVGVQIPSKCILPF